MTESTTEIVLLLIAIAGAGVVSGLLAGLFGIGGGAVIVPVLYQAFAFVGVDDSVRMHVSVGTSIAIIVPTAIRSFMAHRQRGAVNMEVLRGWLIALPLGAVAASLVAAYLPGGVLRAVFAIVALAVSVRLLFGKDSWRLGDDLPSSPMRAIVGALIGFISSLMGIGGGVLNNTFMRLYGRPMHEAVATSSGVGVLIAIPAIVGYVVSGWGHAGLPAFSAGFVNIAAAVIVIPSSVIAAPFGVRLAHRLSRRQLEVAFGLFLIFVAIRFLISLL